MLKEQCNLYNYDWDVEICILENTVTLEQINKLKKYAKLLSCICPMKNLRHKLRKKLLETFIKINK